jgi:hypothetical protein
MTWIAIVLLPWNYCTRQESFSWMHSCKHIHIYTHTHMFLVVVVVKNLTLGHILAITAMVGPPTYPAPMQQIFSSKSSLMLCCKIVVECVTDWLVGWLVVHSIIFVQANELMCFIWRDRKGGGSECVRYTVCHMPTNEKILLSLCYLYCSSICCVFVDCVVVAPNVRVLRNSTATGRRTEVSTVYSG